MQLPLLINLGSYPLSIVFDLFQYLREREWVVENEMGNLNLCDDVLPNNFKIFVSSSCCVMKAITQIWIETAPKL